MILSCEKCGFKMTSPAPQPDEIRRYYESRDYISHDTKEKNLMNLAYKFLRFFTLRAKGKIVRKNSSGVKILDIGCGTGEFLARMRKMGYDCSGVEPNEKARAFAERKHSLPVYNIIKAKELETGTYDCITLWHVLEHMHDLNETVSALKGLLKPTGKIILALPNPESWDAKYYKQFWAAYDLPRHLYHFSARNISDLATRFGLQVEKTLPQYLDAFYISLLSEKYKSGKKDPVMGTINGIRSNCNARKSSNGYSSHIYILSPKFS